METTKKLKKAHKIFIIVRMTKDDKIAGWFIEDKKQPIQDMFKSKKDAMTYIEKNYEDITVLAQNRKGKFQYTIEIRDKKVISYLSTATEQSIDTEKTIKALEKSFHYERVIVKTVVEKEVRVEKKVIPTKWIIILSILMIAVVGLVVTEFILAI